MQTSYHFCTIGREEGNEKKRGIGPSTQGGKEKRAVRKERPSVLPERKEKGEVASVTEDAEERSPNQSER